MFLIPIIALGYDVVGKFLRIDVYFQQVAACEMLRVRHRASVAAYTAVVFPSYVTATRVTKHGGASGMMLRLTQSPTSMYLCRMRTRAILSSPTMYRVAT